MSTTNICVLLSPSPMNRPSNDEFPSPEPKPLAEKGSVQLRVTLHPAGISTQLSVVPFTLIRSWGCKGLGCHRSSPRLQRYFTWKVSPSKERSPPPDPLF